MIKFAIFLYKIVDICYNNNKRKIIPHGERNTKMKKVVITIARQYGSGGREIGEKVAELLGIADEGSSLKSELTANGSLEGLVGAVAPVTLGGRDDI